MIGLIRIPFGIYPPRTQDAIVEFVCLWSYCVSKRRWYTSEIFVFLKHNYPGCKKVVEVVEGLTHVDSGNPSCILETWGLFRSRSDPWKCLTKNTTGLRWMSPPYKKSQKKAGGTNGSSESSFVGWSFWQITFLNCEPGMSMSYP